LTLWEEAAVLHFILDFQSYSCWNFEGLQKHLN